MPGTSLGYVPHLPPGTLIFSAIAWRHLLNGGSNHSKSVEEVYGHVGGGKRNLFGGRVRFAARALFGQSVSPEEVLRRHTLFGIYSRALPPQSADSWAAALVDEGVKNSVHNPLKVSVCAKGFRFSTDDLRSCQTCLMHDLEELGFPAWRIHHVLPPLHHCPFHGDALAIEIKGNIGGRMWQLKLPTGVAIERSSLRFEAASDGYVAYLRSWIDLFEGNLPMIAADAWAHCMDLVAAHMGSVDNAVRELSKQLTQSWNSSADRLPDILGIHVQRDFLRSELEHRTAPGRVAQKLIILTACNSLGILPGRGSFPEQLSMPLLSNGQVSPLQAREKILRGALLASGFPLAMVPGLASGDTTFAIGKRTGVHRHQVQRAIVSLPTVSLEQLSDHGSWEADSWLVKEVLRRGEAKAN